jgi:hypothetical protein
LKYIPRFEALAGSNELQIWDMKLQERNGLRGSGC